jgi:hypothetical protein
LLCRKVCIATSKNGCKEISPWFQVNFSSRYDGLPIDSKAKVFAMHIPENVKGITLTIVRDVRRHVIAVLKNVEE